jgi:hypothetical protein
MVWIQVDNGQSSGSAASKSPVRELGTKRKREDGPAASAASPRNGTGKRSRPTSAQAMADFDTLWAPVEQAKSFEPKFWDAIASCIGAFPVISMGTAPPRALTNEINHSSHLLAFTSKLRDVRKKEEPRVVRARPGSPLLDAHQILVCKRIEAVFSMTRYLYVTNLHLEDTEKLSELCKEAQEAPVQHGGGLLPTPTFHQMPDVLLQRHLDESRCGTKATQVLCDVWPEHLKTKLGSELTLHSTLADAQNVAEAMARER